GDEVVGTRGPASADPQGQDVGVGPRQVLDQGDVVRRVAGVAADVAAHVQVVAGRGGAEIDADPVLPQRDPDVAVVGQQRALARDVVLDGRANPGGHGELHPGRGAAAGHVQRQLGCAPGDVQPG